MDSALTAHNKKAQQADQVANRVASQLSRSFSFYDGPIR
jgi:hypothetical protein